MILRYDLGGGGLRLFDGEHLVVYRTGAFEMWRLRGSPVVGRFTGHLEPDVLGSLRRLADAAAADASAGSPSGSPPHEPGQPPWGRVERWIANEATLVLPEGREPAGPWAELVATGRTLLESLTNRPLAAIELIVGDDVRTAMLHHRGREVLAADPRSLRLEVAAWRGHFDLVGTWASGPLDLGTDKLVPGWSMEFELDHRFRAGRRRVLHVTAAFDVPVGDARAHFAAETVRAMEPG